jgi:hypothetical protein
MPVMSLSASSSYPPLVCPCHGPGILFFFPGVGVGRLDWREDGLDDVSEGGVVSRGRAGRRVRIFGIDGKKCLVGWVGGRVSAVGEGVGVKSDDDD